MLRTVCARPKPIAGFSRTAVEFLLTRDFLNSPERFFKHLFNTSEETEPGSTTITLIS